MKIPLTTIITGKYTIGKEYVILSSQAPYQGYYYELNNKTFAGKEFNTRAPEIIKITSSKFNPLLNNPSTATYAKLSKIKLSNPKVTSISFDRFRKVSFYCSKINNPTLIKEINEETYNQIKLDPLYKTTYVGTYKNKYQTIGEANTQIPGIETFILSNSDFPGE
jgi:hypothetical protein